MYIGFDIMAAIFGSGFANPIFLAFKHLKAKLRFFSFLQETKQKLWLKEVLGFVKITRSYLPDKAVFHEISPQFSSGLVNGRLFSLILSGNGENIGHVVFGVVHAGKIAV